LSRPGMLQNCTVVNPLVCPHRRKRQLPRLLFTTRPVTNHHLPTTARQVPTAAAQGGSLDLDAHRSIASVPCLALHFRAALRAATIHRLIVNSVRRQLPRTRR
jgi:hypothetical protein